jgi:hypothetical protein
VKFTLSSSLHLLYLNIDIEIKPFKMSQSDIEKHSTHSPDVLEKSDVQAYSISGVQRRKWWTIGGKDISFAPVDKDSVAESIDDFENRGIAGVHGSVFDDTDAKLFYAPVEKYEGRHRFDPDATWTPEEEHRLLKTVGLFPVVSEKDANDIWMQLDWRICLPVCLMFFAL